LGVRDITGDREQRCQEENVLIRERQRVAPDDYMRVKDREGVLEERLFIVEEGERIAQQDVSICVAVCCSVLQCVAVCCSVLQGVLQCVAWFVLLERKSELRNTM